VVGMFPCYAEGDDVVVLTGENQEATTLHFLRQQVPTNGICYCLADFIIGNKEKPDYIGLFVTTMGNLIDEIATYYEKRNDDMKYILVKALGDRLVESLTEYLHEKVRKEIWGYAKDENLTVKELIEEKYLGIRPAPGYPACPDHTEKITIWDILNVKKTIGVSLTESMMMKPASSVCGYYFAHPSSRYFAITMLGMDQIEDYASRKKLSVSEVLWWLGHLVPEYQGKQLAKYQM